MQEMSFWQLVRDNPEWAGVLATSIFAIVTIGVIIWQVRVMVWQGRNSERHERIQNKLIRLQHEHEWLLRLNAEREQILKLARRLHIDVSCLTPVEQSTDYIRWGQVQDKAYELNERLRILDSALYTTSDDHWYARLVAYVDALLKAVTDDTNYKTIYGASNPTPELSTRTALKSADAQHKPIGIFLDIEAAIRMQFLEFKQKWDAALPS